MSAAVEIALKDLVLAAAQRLICKHVCAAVWVPGDAPHVPECVDACSVLGIEPEPMP